MDKDGGSPLFSVLIVDDDPGISRFVTALLRLEGFRALSALNAADGLTSLLRDRPDLIILDLAMPGTDGRAFYQMARDQGYRGPTIICSAFGAQTAQRELGAEASIEKPFEPDALLTSINCLRPPSTCSNS